MERIFVIDNNIKESELLQKILAQNGYQVDISIESQKKVTDTIASEKYKLLIIRYGKGWEENYEVIEWLKNRSDKTPVMLLVDKGKKINTEDLQPCNIIRTMETPLDFAKLISSVARLFESTGFTGTVKNVELVEYLQLFSINSYTKAMKVTKDDKVGVIIVFKGEIIYAKQGDLKGEEAFFDIISWEGGRFQEVRINSMPIPNIHSTTMRLLVEAMRLRDDRHSQENPLPDDGAVAADMTVNMEQPLDRTGTSMVQADAGKHRPDNYLQTTQPPMPAADAGRYPFRNAIRNRRALHFNGLILVLILIAAASFFWKDRFPLSLHRATVSTSPSADTTVERGVADPIRDRHQSLSSEAPDGGTPTVAKADSSPGENVIPPARPKTREVILRLHGSNTIGAKLAPALTESYLKRLQPKEVRMIPGENHEERSFEAEFDDIVKIIEIKAHGSSTGFKGLSAHACDIGMASRPIKAKEIEALKSSGNMKSSSSENVLGLDGIAVILNKSNPIDQLRIDTIKGIFSGKIRDWSETSGKKGPINVYARDNNSGTFDTFKSIVLGKKTPLVETARRFDSNAQLSDEVSKDPNGIGFTGLPYIRNSKAIAVAAPGTDPIFPNFFTVATEDYSLSRRLFLYIPPNSHNPYATDFINYALSKKGQEIVKETGFVDLNIKRFPPTEVNIGNIQNQKTIDEYLAATRKALRLSLNFRFHPGSIDLDNRAMRDLDRMVDYLKDHPEWGVVLVGFADSAGEYDYNKQLAEQRASAVASELHARGITVSKKMSASEEMPVASNATEDGREKNRRVEVWVNKASG